MNKREWPLLIYCSYKSNRTSKSCGGGGGVWTAVFNFIPSTCHFSFLLNLLICALEFYIIELYIRSFHLVLHQKYVSIFTFCLHGISILRFLFLKLWSPFQLLKTTSVIICVWHTPESVTSVHISPVLGRWCLQAPRPSSCGSPGDDRGSAATATCLPALAEDPVTHGVALRPFLLLPEEGSV